MKPAEDLLAIVKELNVKANGQDIEKYLEVKRLAENLVSQIKILGEYKPNFRDLLASNTCPVCGGDLVYSGMQYGPAGPQATKSCKQCGSILTWKGGEISDSQNG